MYYLAVTLPKQALFPGSVLSEYFEKVGNTALNIFLTG
jgi:hypothetical protein